MSDFLFASNPQRRSQLAQPLQALMPVPERIAVTEYQGDWGALAVSQSPYQGFVPYETAEHLCAVIGGPVLCWRDNHFLAEHKPSSAASRAILERYLSGQADWAEDLSGPFVLLIIDKLKQQLYCITDHMLFIPVYQYHQEADWVLGTHVDAVAQVSEQEHAIDPVSVDDYILHGVVTYPHTMFTQIFQLEPATQYCWTFNRQHNLESWETYWEPKEYNPYRNMTEAAAAFRVGVLDHIERITAQLDSVGLFISAGEDSRSIAGMLPTRLKRHGYVFLDSKNREFNIAQRVARAYGCVFHALVRSPTHYVDILPAASRLVGSGLQYTHAHSLGLAEESGLDQQQAVFGGYGADALLKAAHARTFNAWQRLKFLPDIEQQGETRTQPLVANGYASEHLAAIDHRRRQHMQKVQAIRPKSCHEWFVLWPYSMLKSNTNIAVNRRLFPSYELYTCKAAVQHAACIPVKWKNNRRFFHKAVKAYFAKSQFIPHPTGIFPYYGLAVNLWSKPLIQIWQRLQRQVKGARYEGAWSDWSKNIHLLLARAGCDAQDLQGLSTEQKINYVQHHSYLLKMNKA
ncbi:asparagine synthase-related protein [Denitrificimonas sp. JX-1]|uniref:asparagine synthase (glutamine-hydrolyzing) n=1 Tax=Denitrificimonas halotolerans TaxID=3098930 RepID=A0ABU5GR24_9GAMM|nr:asparagine synthase-related protein [Denitrificimonas sp. JX-1]MDY7219438.1 asparagine synthase-related protein [Denitrificimonas sp. JX-1]